MLCDTFGTLFLSLLDSLTTNSWNDFCCIFCRFSCKM